MEKASLEKKLVLRLLARRVATVTESWEPLEQACGKQGEEVRGRRLQPSLAKLWQALFGMGEPNGELETSIVEGEV